MSIEVLKPGSSQPDLSPKPTHRVPERFRAENEPGYYPDRIIDRLSVRYQSANNLINEYMRPIVEIGDSYRSHHVAEKLKDLLWYNAYGRAFPLPNSAGDFIAAVESPDEKYKNSIALILVGKLGQEKLAVPGGFNDIGESMAATIAREAAEEIGAQESHSFAFIGEVSRPQRDSRFPVVSTVAAACVPYESIQAGDDAARVVVVPLIDKNGQLDDSYWTAGTYTDIDGKEFIHTGLRADHERILRLAYKKWKRHDDKISLTSMLNDVSQEVPQSWFSAQPHEAGTDTYQWLNIETGELTEKKPHEGKAALYTPNIAFMLTESQKILTEAHMPDSDRVARQLVQNLIERDILPLFPQAAVTTDCLLVRDDKLIVHKLPNGKLALPGSFYSREDNTADAQAFMEKVIYEKYDVDATIEDCIGTVGGSDALGRPADPRYPRLSIIYVATYTASYEPKPANLLPGSSIVEVDLYNPETGEISSILQDDSLWAYGHAAEIIRPLFIPKIAHLKEKYGPITADRLVRRMNVS